MTRYDSYGYPCHPGSRDYATADPQRKPMTYTADCHSIQSLLSLELHVAQHDGGKWRVDQDTAFVVYHGVAIPTRCSGRIEVGGTIVRWHGKLESVQALSVGWRCEFAVEGEEIGE